MRHPIPRRNLVLEARLESRIVPTIVPGCGANARRTRTAAPARPGESDISSLRAGRPLFARELRGKLSISMAKEHEGPERRQHVRVRPLAEYEVRADLLAGPISERLQVVDVSVGGLKLLLTPGL